MRLQFGTANPAAAGITSAGLETTSNAGRKAGLTENTGTPDRISLSETSSLLNRYEVNRSNRIQQLTEAVQAGTYQISSHDLGRSLVSAALGE